MVIFNCYCSSTINLFSADEGSRTRPRYRNYFHAATTIARVEGFRGLYQGLSPSIVAAPLSWGLYFHL